MSGDVAERIERLREQAEQEAPRPESWIPAEPGDEVAGTLARFASASTRDGKPADIAILDTAEGERAVWLVNIVLRDRFTTLRPKPGQLVYCRFEGSRTSKSGRTYKNFTVEVEGDQDADAEVSRRREVGTALHTPLEPNNGGGDDDCPF